MSFPVALPALGRRPLLPLLVALIAIVGLWVAHPTVGDLQAAIAREEAARSGVGLGTGSAGTAGSRPAATR